MGDEIGGACSTHGRETKYDILITKPERKRPLEIPMFWWDNIRMKLRELWNDGVA
jgi:hypothetical protein